MPGSDPANRSRRVILAAIGALLVVAIGIGAVIATADGEGGPDFDVGEDVEPLGDIRAGSVASLVACDDWTAGSVERKQATVVDIREQLSGGGTIEGRPAISDQEAYDVFERACAEDFTGRFNLYKIYYRANAFEDFDPYQYSEQPGEEAEAP